MEEIYFDVKCSYYFVPTNQSSLQQNTQLIQSPPFIFQYVNYIRIPRN